MTIYRTAINNCLILTTLFALLALGSGAVYAEQGDVQINAPVGLDLYQDGGRLIYRLAIPAGTSRVLLPLDFGTVVQIDGADNWHEMKSRDALQELPLPDAVPALLATMQQLGERQTAVGEREQLAAQLSDKIQSRLPVRAQDIAPDNSGWQASIEALIKLRQSNVQERLAVDDAIRTLRERADVLTGQLAQQLGKQSASLAELLGLQDNEPIRFWTNEQIARRWQAMTEAVVAQRWLMVHRQQAGDITIQTIRGDMGWSAQARLFIKNKQATLIRQARITTSTSFPLPPMPTRLIAGGRSQPLAGAVLQPRFIQRMNAPVAEQRSVTVTTRAADWQEENDEAPLVVTDRLQSWALPRLTLIGEQGDQVVELQSDVIELLTDEWLLAPELRTVLARRLSLRLDARPLLAGPLELIVDDTVLGTHLFSTMAPGTILHLSGGEDQRIFVNQQTSWDEDPNRPPNRKREGRDYHLLNLSEVAIRFACYLTVPISSIPELTRSVDPATSAGWVELQPGILRWELELKPGEARILQRGWVLAAAGQVKL